MWRFGLLLVARVDGLGYSFCWGRGGNAFELLRDGGWALSGAAEGLKGYGDVREGEGASQNVIVWTESGKGGYRLERGSLFTQKSYEL